MKVKEEWGVFLIEIEKLPIKTLVKITDEEFIELAKKDGKDYKLEEFEELLKKGFSISNYWVKIIKTRTYLKLDY